jgi:hypothetical protein
MHGALHLARQRAIHGDKYLKAGKDNRDGESNFAGQAVAKSGRQSFDDLFFGFAVFRAQLRIPFSLK